MKKQYEAPKAKKIIFDYTENVVASGTISKEGVGGEKCESHCTPTKYGIPFVTWKCVWDW